MKCGDVDAHIGPKGGRILALGALELSEIGIILGIAFAAVLVLDVMSQAAFKTSLVVAVVTFQVLDFFVFGLWGACTYDVF